MLPPTIHFELGAFVPPHTHVVFYYRVSDAIIVHISPDELETTDTAQPDVTIL